MAKPPTHKVNELVMHLVVAILTVLALVFFALGWREALIVRCRFRSSTR